MSTSQQLFLALQEWIDTDTWQASFTYLQNHRQLLSDEALRILTILERRAPSEEAANLLNKHRKLLLACRYDGLDAGYSQVVGWTDDQPFSVTELKAAIQQLPKTPDTATTRQHICQTALIHLDRQRDMSDWASFQNELGLAYMQDLSADRGQTVENAIACYRKALQAFTEAEISIECAITNNNLANAYLYRIAGDHHQNLQQAIACAQQALTILREPEPHVDREMWPMLAPHLEQAYAVAQRNLGAALQDSGQLIVAIDHLSTALSHFHPKKTPVQWQGTHYRLGQAYQDRTDGDRASNLNKAISHFEAIQPHLDKTVYHDIWCEVHHRLGLAYAERRDGDRAINVEKGIQLLHQAIAAYDPEANRENWASAHADLGMLYTERYGQDPSTNIETGINYIKKGLSILTREQYSGNWFKLQNNLAQAYLRRVKGERRQNLEKCIDHLRMALNTLDTLTTRDQQHWQAVIKNNLCQAFTERIEGEPADNIEQALTHGREALRLLNPKTDAEVWGSVHNNLSRAYGLRILGERLENVHTSIEHAQQALTVFTKERDAVRWAQNMLNMGSMMLEMGMNFPGDQLPVTRIGASKANQSLFYTRVQYVDEAIAATEAALTVYTREHYQLHWAMAATNLALMYLDRLTGDKRENIQRAVDLLTEVGTVYTRNAYPERWARNEMNLGVAWSRLAELDKGSTSNWRQAAAHCRQALTLFTFDAYPQDYLQTVRNLGNIYLYLEHWAEATEWYEQYLENTQAQLAEAYSEGGRLATAAANNDVAGLLAMAYLKQGDVMAAIASLEAGKAQLLADALQQTAYRISQLPDDQQQAIRAAQTAVRTCETAIHESDSPTIPQRQALAQVRQRLRQALQVAQKAMPDLFPPRLTAADILQTVPDSTALVLPLLTELGSAVIVVPAGQTVLAEDNVVWLQGNKRDILESLFLDSPDYHGWLDAYEQQRQQPEKWEQAIHTVTGRLWQLFIAPLLPQLEERKATNLVILSQGWLQMLPLHAAWRQQGEARRYLIQDYVVQYAPSVRTYRQVLAQQRSLTAAANCLAVTDPTDSLDYTEVEIALLKKALPHTEILSRATTADILKQSGYDLFHFAGHGHYNFEDVQQSGLVCADGLLTLHRIQRQMPLEKTRLVVLSACETGLVDMGKATDEFIGLPSGFLSAGVSAVVSALWPVEDSATMALMAHFYKQIGEGVKPAAALQEAQLWLAEVTAGELASFFARQGQMALWRKFASLDATVTPYRHPHFWAAFTLTGC
jgi:CHAT domain-containing protein